MPSTINRSYLNDAGASVSSKTIRRKLADLRGKTSRATTTDHANFNVGQVMKTTPELADFLLQLSHTIKRALDQDTFNMHQPFYTVGLQWDKESNSRISSHKFKTMMT
ncbi:hypothetical protein TNCV_3419621 [Trichonephila clavipes]|nr:hypothetical protein TNCV_3419621 [Trichonephila clavipes]